MATKPELARLIVAPSDTDADMLYATRIFIGDPFIFLQQNGKRTLVLSDLEIDRAKKNAKADEFVMFSQLEREVQGKAKKAPPYEKVLAHFLTKRGVRRQRCRLISRWVLLMRLSGRGSRWKRATGFSGRRERRKQRRKFGCSSARCGS